MRKAFVPILILTLLGLPGAVVCVVGVQKILDLHRFLSAARVVTGRVSEFKYLRPTEDGSLYDMSVEYPHASGRMRHVSIQTPNSNYAVGQSVEVLYTETEARIRGMGTTWGNPLIFAISGLAWAGFAIFMMVIVLKPSREPRT